MLAAAMVAVLLGSTGAVAYLGAAMVARHRAQAAADLAALAGAARLPAGGVEACARATDVARSMRITRAECAVENLDVVVTVEVSLTIAGAARAAARAGPSTTP
ncbi:flp pilus-assembly TadE/G-like family protein [Mycobacterium bourgelatii]|nr:flp pilus-assembly TadE/G-like family protein [Mycobacterium bourgelatii]